MAKPSAQEMMANAMTPHPFTPDYASSLCLNCGNLERDTVHQHKDDDIYDRVMDRVNAHQVAMDGISERYVDDESLQFKMPTLQLLCIDLGDSCVVRVEKGELPADLLTPPVQPHNSLPMIHGGTFIELRAAIDALEEKPAEPYFYYKVNEAGKKDVFLASWGYNGHVQDGIYHAACQLVGRDLVIHDSSKGEWTQILRPSADLPFKVWRYVVK